MNAKEFIEEGKSILGIELGSTRIKAVLIDGKGNVLASGGQVWENRFENGVWTYSMEDIWGGLRACYKDLKRDVKEKYGVTITKLGAIGFSAMMHGYLAFDKAGELLVPFRTWRNTITEEASKKLTEAFSYNIPQRWSISHLYQAVLNGEEHVKDIAFFTTLAGFVHWKLTGEKVLGVGDASGMFPIDETTGTYNEKMLDKFDELVSGKGYSWKIREILPKVLFAGEGAGVLSKEGARLLDESGDLEEGTGLCPPEGDAGTGMAATNSVSVRTGNVSAGTSVFAMIVLEKNLSKVYTEIDMVTTPAGKPVAMVHCNNCTNEINAWAKVFGGFLEALGQKADMNEVYSAMFNEALKGDKAAGGLILYNYLSGEPITGLSEGRPLLLRTPEASLDFPGFMRSQLYSALATLKLGMDILSEENVSLDRLLGHGGFFKTPLAGQRIMAAAAQAPVSVMETAGEGGPWGMALLAAYMSERDEGQSLEDYLDNVIFKGQKVTTIEPDKEDVEGFGKFMESYKKGLIVERCAVENIK